MNNSAFSLIRFQSALLYSGTLRGGDLLNTGCTSMSVTIIPSWSEKPGVIEQCLTSEGLFVRCSSKMLPNELVYHSFDSGESRYIYPVVYDNG